MVHSRSQLLRGNHGMECCSSSLDSSNSTVIENIENRKFQDEEKGSSFSSFKFQFKRNKNFVKKPSWSLAKARRVSWVTF